MVGYYFWTVSQLKSNSKQVHRYTQVLNPLLTILTHLSRFPYTSLSLDQLTLTPVFALLTETFRNQHQASAYFRHSVLLRW